jgi:hypothetical protein
MTLISMRRGPVRARRLRREAIHVPRWSDCINSGGRPVLPFIAQSDSGPDAFDDQGPLEAGAVHQLVQHALPWRPEASRLHSPRSPPTQAGSLSIGRIGRSSGPQSRTRANQTVATSCSCGCTTTALGQRTTCGGPSAQFLRIRKAIPPRITGSPPTMSLRSSAQCGPAKSCLRRPMAGLRRAVAMPPDDVWWLLVRWTDAAGLRWELSEQGPTLLRAEPRKLRTWGWQMWRPKRDW